VSEGEAEEIVLPDGSVLPPGYVPGSSDDPPEDTTTPPEGWDEYYANLTFPEG